KTYSQPGPLAGKDSIQVRLSLACLKIFRVSTKDPGRCGTLNITAVLSWPLLGISSGPMTAKRVSLKGESSILLNRIRKPYRTAASRLATAAAPSSRRAVSAATDVLETGIRRAWGMFLLSQVRHCDN